MSSKNISYLYPLSGKKFNTDITKKNNLTADSTILRTYILQAYGLWFIINMKIHTEIGKIYHKVKHLNRKNKKEFEYRIQLMKDNTIYSVFGQTEALNDSLNLQQEPRTITKIISNQFYCLENIKFGVEVEKVESQKWLSNFTAACRNVDKSCIYVDHPNKCLKHEKYFCPYYTTCQMCGLSMVGGELFPHFEAKHSDIVQRSASIWRPIFTGKKYNLSVLTFGRESIVCEYEFNDDGFYLFVFTPLKNEELRHYQCEITFTDVATGSIVGYVLDPVEKEIYDWWTEVKKENIPMSQEKFEVSVNISKVEMNVKKEINKNIRKYSEYSKPKPFRSRNRKSLMS